MALSLKKTNKVDGPVPPKRERGGKAEPAGSKRAGKRFVLLIGDEGAILIFMQGAKVVRRLFAPSAQPSHSEAMTEIMKANPAVPISVLVDVLDQQYVPQTFPPVSSMSVGGLVKRRLERDFQADDLKGSLQLGRDKTGRKEWKYLLVALAKTPLMAEWLDLIVELPNETKGIYLVPIEAVNYVGMIGRKLSSDKPRPWQLLISHNKVSGFRQVVMHDGKLIFTRVSQAIDDAIPAVIAGNIEQEIINTVEYLKRLEFRDSADLEATIVVSQDVIDTLDLKRFSFGRAVALSPMNVSEMLGLEQAALTADRFGDVVMAAAFGISKRRMLRFSNAYIEKLSKLYKASIGIRVFAALAVITLIGAMVSTLTDMVDDYSDVSHSEAKQSLVKKDLDKLKKAVEGLNQDVAFKSAVVATYDSYLKDIVKPEDFVTQIAPLVTQQQRVVNFSWDMADASKTTPAAPGATADKLPLSVEVNVDFAGAGSTLDVVDRTANDFLAALKAKMPQYDVVADAFPWKKDESHGAEDAALELSAPSSISVQNAVATIHLHGIKMGDASNPGIANSPVAGNPAPTPGQLGVSGQGGR